MRLGCCGSPDQAQALKDAGFDFLEVSVQAVLRGDEPDSTYDATAPDPARIALPVEAANVLVPGVRPIIGPQRSLPDLQTYMKRVAARAGRLGIQRLVFGSGKARCRPEGVCEHDANQQLCEFVRMAGEACAKHDIVLVIEHLHAGECNTINRLCQARQLCDQVGHRHVGVLVDSYHWALEKEKDDSIVALGDRIQHVHVAELAGRLQPGAHGPNAAQAYDFGHFFLLLQKTGYNQRISIEAKWSGPIEQVGAATAAYLRQAWSRTAACEC